MNKPKRPVQPPPHYRKKVEPPPPVKAMLIPPEKSPELPPPETLVKANPIPQPVQQTLQQRRAHHALQKVQIALNKPGFNQKEFKANAASLPAMVRMNGLGQAAAYCRSQKDDTWQVLYVLLSEWLTHADQPYAGQADLLTGITDLGQDEYRVAQVESLLLLDWVKKFAKAFARD